MKFEFGMIVTADFLPETRAMLLCPRPTSSGYKGDWLAVVLRDEAPLGASWAPGDIITLAENSAGLRIVDTPEGSE